MGESVSNGKKPKVTDRRYLRPDEANRLIDAAGQRGRHPFRDKVLVRLVYHHGLRASEAVGLRWSQIDLETGVIHIARVKGSQDSTQYNGPRRTARPAQAASAGLGALRV